MSGESLLAIASEMLRETNVFSKDISEIRYNSSWEAYEISLLGCVEDETKKYNHRFRGKSEKNLLIAYKCIADAMVIYLESYSAVYSFKQQTRINFVAWLKKIRNMYSLTESDAPIPAELDIDAKELDTGVALIKLLHKRDGITYEGLKNGLGGISDRAIQKDLVKISPSLYTGKGSPDVPFKLGGQPLLAEIQLVDQYETRAKEKRFRTLNSVHPLVLQENIMQLATLLKALCHQFYDREDDVSRFIAVDIWSQMSDYARNKIIDYFSFDDIDFEDFISLIGDNCPDDHACTYRTEQSMLDEIEMSVDQAVRYLMKAPGRTGIIKLTSGEQIAAKEILPITLSDGSKVYRITDNYGASNIFTKTQIDDVIIRRR